MAGAGAARVDALRRRRGRDVAVEGCNRPRKVVLIVDERGRLGKSRTCRAAVDRSTVPPPAIEAKREAPLPIHASAARSIAAVRAWCEICKDVFLLGNAWTAREGRWEGRERFSCLQAMCSRYMRRPDGGCAAGGEDLQLDQHGLMLMLMLVLMGGDRLQLLGCHSLLLLGVFPVVDRTATHWTHRQPTVNTEQELVRQGTCVCVVCVCVCVVSCVR